MNYLFHILVMINIYIILALSLNLLVGYTGLLSLCHAALYGIGAYITTLLLIHTGLGFLPSLLMAMVGTALISLIVSIPSTRLYGDYFVLATLGFQIIIFAVLYNWISVTRGPYGIPGIPRPAIFGLIFNSVPAYFLFSGILAGLCAWLLYLIKTSPFGRALKTIREDETAAAAFGKNIPRLKNTAFAISAGFAAVSGALFAGYMQYIDPTSFTVMESVLILSILIIGGTGNLKGPVIGAVVMLLLPEILRFLGMPDSIAANMRQIIYGLVLIILLRYKQEGLAGVYRFQ